MPTTFKILFCANPIVTPPEFCTVNVPVVVADESAGKNCAADLTLPLASLNALA